MSCAHLFKYVFGIYFLKKVTFLLSANFDTIATVKVKLIPGIYTWAIVLVTNKKNGKKQISMF